MWSTYHIMYFWQWIREAEWPKQRCWNLVPFIHSTKQKMAMAASPFTSLLPVSTPSSSHPSSKLPPFRALRASASDSVVVPASHCRREFLKGIALQALSLPLLVLTQPHHSQAREIEVGSFLPPSQSDPSFVLFKASPKDTPALRAGTFYLPSSPKNCN